MAAERTLTARAAAFKTLNECDLFHHDAAQILSHLLGRTDRPAQATDIVFGVIRNRGTIDHILKRCAKTDPSRVKFAVWNRLRIAVYELVYAPQTADYAILNEAVQSAGNAESPKAAGFTNAILRNVQRAIEARQAPLNAGLLRRMIPQTPDWGCLFRSDLLPDPDKETTQYYSTAFSLPQTLVHSWLKTYGADQTRTLCFASNRHPSVIVQPNTLRVTAEQLTQKLIADKIEADRKAGAIRISSTGRINTNSAYLEGLFYVQDATAADAMNLTNPQPDWTVLDLCAAPGGKCMTLAMLTKDAATILASDSDAERLQLVRQNIQRLRLQSIEIVPANRLEHQVRRQKCLDAIVLDVPCSNTGVLARRVEARWRWKLEHTETLQKIQWNLLNQAVQIARPQTRIVYSTCSIQPGENEQQIRRFLDEYRQWILDAEKLTLPALETEEAFDHDGGYVAVMRLR
jgi:16S rRNA (cytosine967-C5)-methyltransferase